MFQNVFEHFREGAGAFRGSIGLLMSFKNIHKCFAFLGVSEECLGASQAFGRASGDFKEV